MEESDPKDPRKCSREEVIELYKICRTISGTDVRFGLVSCFSGVCGMQSPSMWNLKDMNFEDFSERVASRIHSNAFSCPAVVKQLKTLMPDYKNYVIPTKYLISLLGALDFLGNAKRKIK